MALGQMTNGVTVREMAQAYSAFANDGVFTYGRSYSLVTDSDGTIIIDNQPETIVAFEPNTAYTMTYMMQNAVNAGTGGEASLGYMPVAGKTGTSGEYKDRWFVGLTPYYVGAVWTGYDQPERIGISGNPAAKLWRTVMHQIHQGLSYRAFTYPYIGPNTGIFDIFDEDLEDEKEAEIVEGEEDTGTSSGGDTGGGGNYDDGYVDGSYDEDYDDGYTDDDYYEEDDGSSDENATIIIG